MSLPAQTRVIEIARSGGPEVLTEARRPMPVPGPGQALIRTAYAGVNRPDCLQRAGGYPPPPGASDIPGLEVAGEIAALGPEAVGLKLGDEVCALVAGGGYADYCLAETAHCLPFPKNFSAREAVCLPETFFTVWHNVVQRCRLAAGENFLVHGGASGIGTTAIQIAKALGAKVFATAGGAAKCQACRDLGADVAIDYKSEDFVEKIEEATGKKGIDVILDMVGGDYLPKNLKIMAPEGRLALIAFLKGPKVETNFLPVMLKRLTITGSTLRPQSNARKAEIAAELKERIWPLLDLGRIRPVIHAEFPLTRADEAHRLMESNAHIGKIILKI